MRKEAKYNIYNILVNVGIKHIVVMPDSMNVRLLRYIPDDQDINIIQVLNETDAVTVTSGLNLTGQLSIAMFENSGIRSACDILTRLELSHHIHNIYFLSSRGGIGEENWWGVMHRKVTTNILDELNIFQIDINNIEMLEYELYNAIKTFKTEQISVTLNFTPMFFENLD